MKKERNNMKKQRFFALYGKSGRLNDYEFYERDFGTWHDVLKAMKRCTQPCYIVEQIKEEGRCWHDVRDADGQPIILKTKNWEEQ
jgi:hypothetical protein